MEGVEDFLREHSHLPFEELLNTYEENEPRVKTGKHFAYILYGGTGPFFLDGGGHLTTDIRGLVYKPIARRKGNRIVAEF